MTARGSKAATKGEPASRTDRPAGAPTKESAETLLAGLDGAFTEAERRQILVGALIGMDRVAQERLCAQLGATGTTLASLLGLAPVAPDQAPAAMSPQRLEQDWQALWKEWDRILKATDNPKGPYLQHSISFTTPDLDTDTLVADLDKVAAKLLPLLPLRLVDPGPKPLNLAKKLSSSLNKIAPSHSTYIILPEEAVSLGAATTKLALAWLWQNAPQEGHAEKLSKLGALAKALFECVPYFCLDEDTQASFLKSLGAEAHQEMVQWLEKNREKEPWKEAFGDDPWGSCVSIVALLCGDD